LFSQLKILSVASNLKSLSSSDTLRGEREASIVDPEATLFTSLETSDLDSQFVKLRVRFSTEEKYILSVKEHFAFENIRHEFEAYDFRLQTHLLKQTVDA